MNSSVLNGKQIQSSVSVENGKIFITGHILALPGPMTIKWRAAAPSTKGMSFSGSGFPHPNQEQAYDVRSTSGELKSTAGMFKLTLDEMPGAYYSGLGSIYVPPHVEFDAMNSTGKTWKGTVLLAEYDIPFRWISGSPPGIPSSNNPDEGRAMFYKWNPDSGVRSQEAILRSRAFPTLASFSTN